jgi:hypothetical protein
MVVEPRFVRGMVIFAILMAGALTALPAAMAAEGGSQEKPWDRFTLNLGGFITTLNSTATIGSERTGVGATVNFQEALGLDSSLSVFRGEALYRFGDSMRHRVDFGYFDLRRTATKTLQRDVQIGDKVYPIGTTVDSRVDLQIMKGTYSYSLFQDNRFDLGVSVGAFVAPVSIKINSTHLGEADKNFTAPLPVVGMHFDFAITPKFFIKQRVDFFYLEYKSFKGSLLDAAIGVEYNIWKHFGAGLAYNFFFMRVEASSDSSSPVKLNGNAEFSFSGLMLYGKIMF